MLFSLLQFRRPADAQSSRFSFSVNVIFFYFFFVDTFSCPVFCCLCFFRQISPPRLYRCRSFTCLLLQLIRLSHFTAILLIANLVVAQLYQSQCCQQSPTGAATSHLSWCCLQLLSIYLPELMQFSLLAFGVFGILFLWLTYTIKTTAKLLLLSVNIFTLE